MLHVYMLDCAARLVTAQDVAKSAFALRIKRGFCCRLLPLILLPLGSYQPFNLRSVEPMGVACGREAPKGNHVS